MKSIDLRDGRATGRRAAPCVVIGTHRPLCAALRPPLLAASFATCLLLPISHAAPLPTDGSVVSGIAKIGGDGIGRMHINQQSDRAVIQWDAFDIAHGSRVDVMQPSTDALLINRVMGAGPSQIAGTLHANGSVVLVNRNGINFKKGADVEAANFLASGTDITDQEIDMLAADWRAWNASHGVDAGVDEQADGWGDEQADGRADERGDKRADGWGGERRDQIRDAGRHPAFPAVIDRTGGRAHTGAVPTALLPSRHLVFPHVPTGRGGSHVINQGRIRVRNGGHVGLMGSHVAHTGVIIADGGHIAIAGLGDAQIGRSQSIDAVIGVDATVNVSGLLRANTITRRVHQRHVQARQHGPGRIAIDGRDGAVNIDGTVTATVEHGDVRGTGGDVAVTGRHVRLSHALIDVLGATSGGRIALSTKGPYAGLQRIDVNQGSSLLAQGRGAGNGGDIVVSSVGQTVFDGTAVASGDRSALREIYASGDRADSGVFGRRSRVTPLGEGGTIFVAGLNSLVVGGECDASSAKGARKGVIRFDAHEAMIGNRHLRSRLGGAVMPRMGMIDARTVSGALSGADVSIVAHGKNDYGKKGAIYVSGPVIWHSDATLTLQAAGDISVQDTVRATGKYASFKRQARGPLLLAMSDNGDMRSKVAMTGEHASLTNARPPVVPRLSHYSPLSAKAAEPATYSVAAPARMERGLLLAHRAALSSHRAQFSQLNVQNDGHANDQTRGDPSGEGRRETGFESRGEVSVDAQASRRPSLQLGIDSTASRRATLGRLLTVAVPAPPLTQDDVEVDQEGDVREAKRSDPSLVSRWWMRLSGTSVSAIAPVAARSSAPPKSEEQRTRAEASAFRAASPAESMVRSVGHVHLRMGSLPDVDIGIDRPSERGADKFADEAIDRGIDTRTNKVTDQVSDQPSDQVTDKVADQPMDQYGDRHFLNRPVSPL